jgi:hypothetical protein
MPRKPKGGRRKNVRIDQRKLDLAKKALGTQTETETIEKALDEIVFRQELLEGLRRVAGKFPDWADPFGEDEKGLEFRIPPLPPNR